MIKIFLKAAAGLALVVTFVCCSTVQPAYDNAVNTEPEIMQQPGGHVSIQTFYDELEPYGQWINDPELGYVWSPNVEEGFKPYATRGHWAETEYGNTWVSDYDWGWAAFHYGRWRYDQSYGWEWIPGTEWAPAWVNWRTGGDYYGWAPLGPGINIDIAFGRQYYAPDNYWVFVPRQYLCSPSINRYYLPANRNVTIIRNTSIINNIYNGGSGRYISGPRTAEIQHYAGRPINVYNINNNNRPGATRISNNTINIYRPQIAANGYGNNHAAPARVINRGSNEYNQNRLNNNYGQNNGNPNNNAGFGNTRRLGNQGNGTTQNNNPANQSSGGNNNGFGRPARTDNNNINGNQFPQRGISNPNLNNNTGSNNPASVPANVNGNNPFNSNSRQVREHQAFPNTNGQPGNDWRTSGNFDRNRNRTPIGIQQTQQSQVQRQQEVQQRQMQQQQTQQQQNQQKQQQIQQNQAQQQQRQQQQRQQQIQHQQQERPARQDIPPRSPEQI